MSGELTQLAICAGDARYANVPPMTNGMAMQHSGAPMGGMGGAIGSMQPPAMHSNPNQPATSYYAALHAQQQSQQGYMPHSAQYAGHHTGTHPHSGHQYVQHVPSDYYAVQLVSTQMPLRICVGSRLTECMYAVTAPNKQSCIFLRQSHVIAAIAFPIDTGVHSIGCSASTVSCTKRGPIPGTTAARLTARLFPHELQH